MSNPINISKVRLWTWQKRGFDITDPNIRIEPKYSKYLDASYNPDYCERHQKAYKQLYEYLGTNQFLWCHTNFEDAINGYYHEENKDNILWKINLPEDHVFKKICDMAWHWIVSDGVTLPSKIFANYLSIKDLSSLAKNLDEYWQNMTPKQLWDRLFIEYWGQPCYQVLILHPINKSWIIENPLKDTNWWHTITTRSTHYKPGFPPSRE